MTSPSSRKIGERFIAVAKAEAAALIAVPDLSYDEEFNLLDQSFGDIGQVEVVNQLNLLKNSAAESEEFISNESAQRIFKAIDNWRP